MSLQVLRRKSDLYLSEHLDIKAVFYCGECHFSKLIINAQHLFIYPLTVYVYVGILSFKFPETPTLKATCLLFVSTAQHV